KGFSEPVLTEIVDVITANRDRWVDTMLTEEYGLPLSTPSPIRSGLSTFAAFVAAGFVPLVPYCFAATLAPKSAFAISSVATGMTFFGIGMAKGRVVEQS